MNGFIGKSNERQYNLIEVNQNLILKGDDEKQLAGKFPAMKLAEEEMNGHEILSQKHRNQIRPIFEMLKHKKLELNNKEWEHLVRTTEQSIKNSPDQYLSDFPSGHISDLVIHHLFEEFLNELI